MNPYWDLSKECYEDIIFEIGREIAKKGKLNPKKRSLLYEKLLKKRIKQVKHFLDVLETTGL